MPEIESNIFLLFTRRFDEIGVDYIVTGSVASIAYGEARLTHDVDLVRRSAQGRVLSRRGIGRTSPRHRRDSGVIGGLARR